MGELQTGHQVGDAAMDLPASTTKGTTTSYQLVIIGGGLSGLAAGIRFARFGGRVLIVEQHSIPGGLNSYYFRNGVLLETGLHAMTNFARPGNKQAPLNRLLRQLKLSRKKFVTREQLGSEIIFPGVTLRFSNDLSLLAGEIERVFPEARDRFFDLVRWVESFDPFAPAPWLSTRAFLREKLNHPLLEDMLLLPLMVYGNAEEQDMDLAQFAIMFRALFLEGFFRPEHTIREFLNTLLAQYRRFGGEIRFRTRVQKLIRKGGTIRAVVLEDGEELACEAVLSTVGIPGTAKISGWDLDRSRYIGRMSFMETISLLPAAARRSLKSDRTIIFYNMEDTLNYRRPVAPMDPSWGVICFPENFQGVETGELFQVRVTNAANYDLWKEADRETYLQMKEKWVRESAVSVRKIIGNYTQDVVYQDSFTPVTIERFTGKAAGAVYGSPRKIKDGRTPFANLFLAGTDQGYLGIVGSMLSGVSIVNQHLLR
ncbi:phytoene desaturase family protein [Desulfolithobacter sp.]